MRKSPFSTPRGSSNNQRGRRWYSSSPRRGYARPNNQEACNPNSIETSPQRDGEDFIPFSNVQSQTNNHKSPGNWSNRGGGGGPWRSSPRGNFGQSSPNFNKNNSPREHHQRAPYSNNSRKNFHSSNSPGPFDPLKYINKQSIFEDPWAKLTQKMEPEENRLDTSGALSDLSFNSTTLDKVCLDDSTELGNLSGSQ